MIQRATETITKGRTSIVIAHRLATIVNADKIVVMDQGLIVEQGTHQELIHREGVL
jgi:ABC-type multidrug transport system fused ATPase/permease subunit